MSICSPKPLKTTWLGPSSGRDSCITRPCWVPRPSLHGSQLHLGRSSMPDCPSAHLACSGHPLHGRRWAVVGYEVGFSWQDSVPIPLRLLRKCTNPGSRRISRTGNLRFLPHFHMHGSWGLGPALTYPKISLD